MTISSPSYQLRNPSVTFDFITEIWMEDEQIQSICHFEFASNILMPFIIQRTEFITCKTAEVKILQMGVGKCVLNIRSCNNECALVIDQIVSSSPWNVKCQVSMNSTKLKNHLTVIVIFQNFVLKLVRNRSPRRVNNQKDNIPPNSDEGQPKGSIVLLSIFSLNCKLFEHQRLFRQWL